MSSDPHTAQIKNSTVQGFIGTETTQTMIWWRVCIKCQSKQDPLKREVRQTGIELKRSPKAEDRSGYLGGDA